MKKMFILYDGRAKYVDTDDCAVMDTAESVGGSLAGEPTVLETD